MLFVLFESKDMLYAIRSFIFRLDLIHMKIHGMCQAATFTEKREAEPANCLRLDMLVKPSLSWILSASHCHPQLCGDGNLGEIWGIEQIPIRQDEGVENFDGFWMEKCSQTNMEMFAMHSHYKALLLMASQLLLTSAVCIVIQHLKEGSALEKFRSVLLDSETHLVYGTRVVSRN